VDVVKMPQLGETVTEGTITKWSVAVGDRIAFDDVLFEVSTEKVDTEVPSANEGYVRQVLVAEGETVPIGTPLMVITATADEPFDAPGAPAAAPPEAVERTPPATALAANPTASVESAASGARSATVTALPVRGGGSGFLSPVVRRLLDEHSLAPDQVVGSGDGGRITRADVLAAASQAPRPPTDGQRAPTASARAEAAPVELGRIVPADIEPGDDDEVVEFSRARRNTATNMLRSLAISAHTLVVTEVDYTAVDSVRRKAKLSFLPFVARAAIDAIAEFPNVNASVGDDQLIVHRRINLGFAVDVDNQALVVPVVAGAQELRLRAISDAVTDLAARGRAHRLTKDAHTGGTFTITNVGSYGTLITAPVINQPEVAILSTDGVKMRPVAVRTEAGEWTIAIHPVGNLCLSFDHRAFDGAYASAFLARVRDTLETRDWTQEV